MKFIDLNTFEKDYDSFVSASKNFENSKKYGFDSSYIGSSSNIYVSSMKSKLNEKYQSILMAYHKIEKWWKDYLNDIHAVEKVLSQNHYSFLNSSLSTYVTGKFSALTYTKMALSGKLSIISYNSHFGVSSPNTFGNSGLTLQTMISSQIMMKQEQKDLLLNKYFNGEELSATEVYRISDSLTKMYNEDIKTVNEKYEACSKEYEELNQYFSKMTGMDFDLEKINEMKESSISEAKGLAVQYKNEVDSLSNDYFEWLGMSREEFKKKSVDELSQIILEKDPSIDNFYKRYDSILESTEYGNFDTFLKKITDAQARLYEVSNEKRQIESIAKGTQYAVMSKTKEYQNFKTKEVSNDDVSSVVTVIQNDQNIVQSYTVANYSKYAGMHKDVDPLTFTKKAMELYGDNVTIEGVTNGELLKELAKIQSVDSLKDMGKYYSFAYQNFGAQAASQYLEDYKNEIHQFCGEVQANEFLNTLTSLDETNRASAVTNHLKITGKGLGEGITGVFNNLGYMIEGFFKENREISTQEYENMYIVQALSSDKTKSDQGLVTKNALGEEISTSDIIDYTKDYGKFTEHNYQISESIGNMLPSIGLSAINPFAGTMLLGTSAAGGSYHSAMTEGYSRGESMAYGILSGTSEVLLEKALGAVPLVSDTKVVSLKTMAQAMSDEFKEEFIQSYVDAGISSLVLKKDFDLKSTTQDALQSGIYGGITGGIMNIPSLAINSSSIRTIENQVKAGNVTTTEIENSFHELLPETASMNFNEIMQEYSKPLKEVTLSLINAKGKNATSSGVSTLLGNLLNKSKSSLNAKIDQIKDNISSLNFGPVQELEPALAGVNNLSFMEQAITENSNVKMMLGKTALSSLPKAVASTLTSFTSAPFFFRYVPVTNSPSFYQKILKEGLYHFTSEKSIQKIQESGYIKASDYVSSYGNKKTFFFAGIPNISDMAMNTGNLSEKQIAIKINVSPEELSQFRYRDLVDEAVSYDGNYILDEENYSVVYLGLTEENGQLTYKEISKEEYENYKTNAPSNKITSALQKAETVIIGLASDWSYSKKRLQKLIQVFSNANVAEAHANISEAHSILENASFEEDISSDPFFNIRERELQQFKKIYGQELAQAAWDVHEDAVLKEPPITGLLQTFESSDTQLVGLEHKFKSIERLIEKIQKYANATDCSYTEVGKTMNDALRYTFQIDDDQYANEVNRILTSLIKQGCSVSYFNNSWGKKTYQGINTQIITPEGVDFELQFHTRDSFETKEKNHPYYEIYQSNKSTTKEIIEASKAMAKNQSKVKAPSSMDSVNRLEKKIKLLSSASNLFQGLPDGYFNNFKNYLFNTADISLDENFATELFSPQNYEILSKVGIHYFEHCSNDIIQNFITVYQTNPELASDLLHRTDSSSANNFFSNEMMQKLGGRYELYHYSNLESASQNDLNYIYQMYDQVEDPKAFVQMLNQIQIDQITPYLSVENIVSNASRLPQIEQLIQNLRLPKVQTDLDNLYLTISENLKNEKVSTNILDQIKKNGTYSLDELPLKVQISEGDSISFYAQLNQSYQNLQKALNQFLTSDHSQLIDDTIPLIKENMKPNEKYALLYNTSIEDLKIYQRFKTQDAPMDEHFLSKYKTLHEMCEVIQFYEKNGDQPWKKYFIEQVIKKGEIKANDFEFLSYAINELEGYLGSLKYFDFPNYVLDAMNVSQDSSDPKVNLKNILDRITEKNNFNFAKIMQYKSKSNKEIPQEYKRFPLKRIEGIKEMGDYYGDAGDLVCELFKKGNTSNEVYKNLRGGVDKGNFINFLSTIEGNFLYQLNKEEIKALTYYTGGGFHVINQALRIKYLNSANQKIVDAIDSAIQKYGGLEVATELFRGVTVGSFLKQNSAYAELFDGVDKNDLNQVYATLSVLEGCTFGDLGYMSTSPCYSTSFAKDIGYPIVLDIIADKGTQGAYINQVSEFHNSENEFILAKDTTLKMVKVFPPTEDVNGLRKIVIQCIIE